ncbi:20370_t:CDS:2, partial [Cetraspora pellucida]
KTKNQKVKQINAINTTSYSRYKIDANKYKNAATTGWSATLDKIKVLEIGSITMLIRISLISNQCQHYWASSPSFISLYTAESQ